MRDKMIIVLIWAILAWMVWDFFAWLEYTRPHDWDKYPPRVSPRALSSEPREEKPSPPPVPVR